MWGRTMRTNVRKNKGLFAAAAVVAVAGVAAGTVPASAADTPRFLAPASCRRTRRRPGTPGR